MKVYNLMLFFGVEEEGWSDLEWILMTTFYRKYRPRKISELDLDDVREKLLLDLKSGKLSQAYLMVGPRGAGKTSAARILAKVIDCERNDNGLGEPCLECGMCVGIENGSAVDVLEIDAASHRGIDAMRELKEKIGLAPVLGRSKVYIIDEVHMLTTEAFNSLLKTLEEPPENTYFFLCTTEEHKVPETIISRCVRIGFKKASSKEVGNSLSKVISNENLEISEDAVTLLSRSVDGSFREGHKLLGELAKIGKEIEVEDVQRVVGLGGGSGVLQIVEMLLKGNLEEVLSELDKRSSSGVKWEVLVREMIDVLRKELRGQYGIGEVSLSGDVDRVKTVLLRLADVAREMKGAAIEQLPLELAVMELCELGVKKSPVKVKEVEKKKPLEETINVKSDIENVQNKNPVSEDLVVDTNKLRDTTATLDVSVDEIREKWKEVIAALSPLNHSVAGFLRSCRPKTIEENHLVIEAYYKFHKEQLEQENRRILLEKVLLDQVGVGSVRFVLGERAQQAMKDMSEHDNVSVPKEDKVLVEAAEDVFGT